MTNKTPRPCCVWIVEFTEGVDEGHRKKAYLTALDVTTLDVVRIVAGHHPGAKFTVYNVDAGVLTLPEAMQSGDCLYTPNATRADQSGNITVPEVNDEEGFDDSDSQIITFKPPSMMT
jgi:hypothetical protein